MDRPSSPPRPRRRGCLIAIALAVAVFAACGGGIALLGYQAWDSPQVQLGVRAAGAAIEMNQDALQAPGAQAVRDAGCRHAMVYAPSLMQRFVEDLGVPDGRIVAPTSTMIVCASASEPPSCEAVATAYEEAVPNGGEILVDVFTSEAATPVCEGLYGPSGERLRDPSPDEHSFAEVVRPRVF